MKRKRELERWVWREGSIPAAEQGVASRPTAQQPEIGGRNGGEQVWKDGIILGRGFVRAGMADFSHLRQASEGVSVPSVCF